LTQKKKIIIPAPLQTHWTRICFLIVKISDYICIYFLGGGNWRLNSGLCAYKAGILLLEPCLQSILLWLFFGDGVMRTICPNWPQTSILPISASQEAKITGMSHTCLASDGSAGGTLVKFERSSWGTFRNLTTSLYLTSICTV
jgi:hypothetical protein